MDHHEHIADFFKVGEVAAGREEDKELNRGWQLARAWWFGMPLDQLFRQEDDVRLCWGSQVVIELLLECDGRKS